jgi:hypothetical protein
MVPLRRKPLWHCAGIRYGHDHFLVARPAGANQAVCWKRRTHGWQFLIPAAAARSRLNSPAQASFPGPMLSARCDGVRLGEWPSVIFMNGFPPRRASSHAA